MAYRIGMGYMCLSKPQTYVDKVPLPSNVLVVSLQNPKREKEAISGYLCSLRLRAPFQVCAFEKRISFQIRWFQRLSMMKIE